MSVTWPGVRKVALGPIATTQPLSQAPHPRDPRELVREGRLLPVVAGATASGGPSGRPPEAEAGYELRRILPSCGATVVLMPELATVVVELPVLTTTVPFVNCLVITPLLMVASPVGLPSWLALL